MNRLAALTLLLPLACLAQFEAASVLGTITDSTGAVIRDARVSLENTATGITGAARTDEAGNYIFLNVRIGTYRVKAEAPGFKAAVADAFTVTVNARQRVDLSLSVGETTQSVEVKAAASALETDSSDRGQVVATSTIVNLPLNGRAYADLALLAPGVRKSAIPDRESSFNVNGLRSALNNFQVDGIDNNAYATSNQGYSNQAIQLNPDAIAEFKVQTNNYSAEYGRAGGAIINATVRSGTNAFHGSLWEYLRNTKLNAVGFFKPATGKPVYQQNQYGAAAGGPIRRNKTFFFGDFEGLRRVTRTVQFATVPTMDQRNGVFGVAIRNPFTGETYSNGTIPSAQITSFAQKVFADLPAPNLGGVSNNFVNMPRNPFHDDKGDGRLDHYFSGKLTAFGRYSHREYNEINAPVIPLPLGANNSQGNVHIVNKQAVAGITLTISPVALLEARMGWTRSIGAKYPLQIGLPDMQAAYGITGLPADPSIAGGLTTQNIGGYIGLGRRGSTPQFQNPVVYNPKVNYSRILPRHTLKFGWENQWIRTEVLDFSPQYGTDSYSGQFTRPSGVSSNNLYNVADFLLGARSTYDLINYLVVNLRQRMSFYYFQDDWKVSQKLTLNLGLRYEYGSPQWEEKNLLSNLDPSTLKLIQAKDGGIYDRSLVHPDRNNWAPRVGLAYNLTPKTVIRSGYGMSYIHFNRLGGENLLSYNGPHLVQVTVDQVPSNPACSGNNFGPACFRRTMAGYPANMVVPQNYNPLTARITYIPSDNRTGYVQSWHFTIQRDLGKGVVLDVGYVGNRGVKLMILGDWNQARPNNWGENLVLQARRPYANMSVVEIAFGGGFSSYHGLQAKLEKRFSLGFYLLNSFTWSKTIDNAPGHLEVFNGDSSRVNYRDMKHDKGTGSYNQPFNNTTTVIYDLPYGHGRKFGASSKSLVNMIAGEWRLTAINTMTSGPPVNVYYSPTSQFSVSGYPAYRPNVTGPVLAAESLRSIDNYFDKANIQVPANPQFPFGNLGRNVARGYSFYQADLGLHKDFPLFKEQTKLEFRTEVFNLLNKTNFGAPNSDRASSGFGTIRSAFPARQVQLALKLVF